MMRISAGTAPLIILALMGQALAQTQRFPAFDPEQIFVLGDADLDGRLSLEEYRELVRASPRMKAAAASIEPLFRRLDTDHDEFISLPEYRKSFPQRPTAAPVKPEASTAKRPEAPATAVAVAAGDKITPDQEKFFETRIRPVLAGQCFKCHASTAEKLRGGLRLDTRDGPRTGGDSGPAVVPGNLEESLLIRAIRYTEKELRMPPKAKLLDQVVADFEAWVKMGAARPKARCGKRHGSPSG